MPTPELVSPAVLRFLDTTFDSVEEMRVLLLLRASPETAWEARTLAAQFGVMPPVVVRILAKFVALDLVAERASDSGPRYRYEAKQPELAGLVDEVFRLDQERPVTLIKAIYSRNQRAITSFAQAFELKRER